MSSQTEPGNGENGKKLSPYFSDPEITGTIKSKEIRESSGLVSSQCNIGVFWTHNDSGDENFIYAFNKKGESLGKWSVTGATNRDWEDIAGFKDRNGECFLYVADFGNNGRIRSEFKIYKFKEPVVSASRTGTSATDNADIITFSYPDLRHNAEALFVHPATQDIYVITKRVSGAAGVYRLAKDGSKAAKKIADIEVPSVPNGLITGADISPDGRRVIVCDYFGGYEFVLPEGSKSFDDIWKEKPRLVDIGTRDQGEAVAYSSDGMAVFSTSEKANSPVFMVKRKVK